MGKKPLKVGYIPGETPGWREPLTLHDGCTLEVRKQSTVTGRVLLLASLKAPKLPGLGAYLEESICESTGTVQIPLTPRALRQNGQDPNVPPELMGQTVFHELTEWGSIALYLARLHADFSRPGAVARLVQYRLRPFLGPQATGHCRRLARAVLDKSAPDMRESTAAVDALTEALRDRCAPFAAFAFPPAQTERDDPWGPEWAEQFARLHSLWLDDSPPPPSSDGTMLLVDELRLRVLETLRPEDAATFRDKYRARWTESRDKPLELWAEWLAGDAAPEALFKLATGVWLLEVQPELVKRASHAPLATKGARGFPSGWAVLPKAGSELSQFASAGVRPVTVEVDGRQFAEPLLTRAVDMLPTPTLKGQQLSFLLSYGLPPGDDSPMVEIVRQTALGERHLSLHAGKIGLLTFCTAHPEASHRITVGELARRIHPEKTRIQGPQLRATAEALEQLRALHAHSRTDKTKVQVYRIPRLPLTPADATRDTEVVLGVEPEFLRVAEQMRQLRGGVLLNLSGVREIPNNKGQLFRSYMLATRGWDRRFHADGDDFTDERVEWITAQEWATATNSLPPGAIEYLRTTDKRAHRKYQSMVRDAQDSAVETLRELAKDFGLLRVDVRQARGKGPEVRALPTADYLEARKRYAQGRKDRATRDAKRGGKR